MVTNFFQYIARLSQGIRVNLAQWLERVANNRKVPGSNPGYAPSMGAWHHNNRQCELLGWRARGACGSMEGSAGPALAGQLRVVPHDSMHWQCEVLGR